MERARPHPIARARGAAPAAVLLAACLAGCVWAGCGGEDLPEPGAVVGQTFERSRLLSDPDLGAEVEIQPLGAAGQPLATRPSRLSPEGYRDLEQALSGAVQGSGGELGGLLGELRTEGVERLGGEEVVHVQASIDVDRLIARARAIAARPGKLAASGGPVPGTEELDRLETMLTDATFDIYSSDPGRRLRRMEMTLTLDPPSSLPPSDLRVTVTPNRDREAR